MCAYAYYSFEMIENRKEETKNTDPSERLSLWYAIWTYNKWVNEWMNELEYAI